jgi:hypothetical protein
MSNIINPSINKKLGYYVCDGVEFNGKIAACFHGVKVGKPVKWVFNNNVFENYNWSIEPDESLDQLYDQRSKQIRESYDYVILSYSGGADSNNIYESFKRQGLLIDELYVNNMLKASEKFIHTDKNNFTSSSAPEVEYKLNLIPRLQEIKNEMPLIKISNFDLSDYIFDYLGKSDESWVLSQREGLNPVNLTRFNYLHYSEVKKTLDKGKSVALVTGIDKPSCFIKNGEFYIKFVDRTANINSVADHTAEYENCTVEYFYWAPESVRMLAKQGHVIKKFLELNPNYQNIWLEHRVDKKMKRLVHERILRTVLYSTWNNDWYQADKSLSDWRNEFDNWFHIYYRDTDAWKNWKKGIDLLAKNLHPFLKYQNNNPDGLKPIAHNYNLGPIHLKENLRTWFE